MVRFEQLIEEIKRLPPAEQRRLLEWLLDIVPLNSEELWAAQRGLKAWTASTRGEDWSAYYPDGLTNTPATS